MNGYEKMDYKEDFRGKRVWENGLQIGLYFISKNYLSPAAFDLVHHDT